MSSGTKYVAIIDFVILTEGYNYWFQIIISSTTYLFIFSWRKTL
jgi:hypothetical protein